MAYRVGLSAHKPLVLNGRQVRGFGVGDSQTAFDQLERTFGTSAPEEAFEMLEETFGVGGTLGATNMASLFQRFGEEAKKAIPPPPKADVTRLGDWKLKSTNRRFSVWKHKPDQDSYPSKMTDEVSVPAQSAIYGHLGPRTAQQREEHRQHWLKALNDVRAQRVRCAKTGQGCGSGGGGMFGAMTKAVEGAVSDVVDGLGTAAGASVDAIADVASGAANETAKALTSMGEFVEKTGGDGLKFIQKQAEKLVEDPAKFMADIATSGGLNLLGVKPEAILNEVGIPSPDQMLDSIGLPTVSDITHESFKTVNDPTQLLDKIPGVKEIARYVPSVNPTQMAAELVNSAVQGDLEGIKNQALDIGHKVADITSMVPGVGNVIGGPLSAAITLIETGSALKAALAALLNQVPGIPPQVRAVLRAAFNAIADIVEKGRSVTDVLLVEFKEGVKEEVQKQGIPGEIADLVESVLNGAVQVIFRSKPLDKAALDLAEQGLEVAKEKAAQGIGSLEEVQAAQEMLFDLEGVYENVNTMHALTQGLRKLNREKMIATPLARATIEKKIKDMQAAIAAEKLAAQMRAKKAAPTKKRAPSLRTKEPTKKAPPSLRKRARPETPLEKLANLSPAEQAKLRELAALKELSPEQRKALAALSPEARAQLEALSPEERRALKTPATGPAVGPDRFGPYPQRRAS